jgi:hypothetical protein
MNMSSSTKLKLRIIAAGEKAIEELIRVAEEKIVLGSHFVGDDDDDGVGVNASLIKNAASTKKIAIFDALDILAKIEEEREAIQNAENGSSRTDTKQGFAERRSKRK